jgi:hypothetical protein
MLCWNIIHVAFRKDSIQTFFYLLIHMYMYVNNIKKTLIETHNIVNCSLIDKNMVFEFVRSHIYERRTRETSTRKGYQDKNNFNRCTKKKHCGRFLCEYYKGFSLSP